MAHEPWAPSGAAAAHGSGADATIYGTPGRDVQEIPQPARDAWRQEPDSAPATALVLFLAELALLLAAAAVEVGRVDAIG